ncbi:MAG: polysaccharide biosynthesis protein [Gemmatimonadota bacterium]
MIRTRVRRIRNRTFLQLDLVLLPLCALLAITVRFEGLSWMSTPWAATMAAYVVISVPLRIALFGWLGVYRRVWEQASISELEVLARAAFAGGAISGTIGLVFPVVSSGAILRVPLSVLALDALLAAAAITLTRYAVRLHRSSRPRALGDGRRILIAGAGAAGQMMAREIAARPELGLTAVGFVDDDPTKLGGLLEMLPVLGSIGEIPRVVRDREIVEIIIAMPSAPGDAVKRVVRAAAEAGVSTRTIPGLYEILSGRFHISALRRVEIHDLLRRAPIETDLSLIRPLISGQTILVTGAGGSIGSELCRQIARLEPSRLILLGHGENSIFEIVEELKRTSPGLKTRAIIADIRDRRRMRTVIHEQSPHIIFHAAAHKHVPLMEANVTDAIKNNVVGTLNVVDAAEREGTPYFVLISSDKAVRPSSVMGASKRVAEQLVQLAARRTGRPYVSVRFGNVLGSRGSVIPTFMRQLRSGGPVLVTDPEMRRYFITIPEAVQLVLQACSMSRSGEVFMLDMGEPVRIVDLASDLIRLSGLREGTDVEIAFTGARPGEKLFEEMFCSEEEVLDTTHPKILRARHTATVVDLPERLATLMTALAAEASEDELRLLLRTLAPDFSGVRTASVRTTSGRSRRFDIEVPVTASKISVVGGPSPELAAG